jgi:hypothetical protein
MAEVDRAVSRKVSSELSAQAPTTADQARRVRGICSAKSQAAYHPITGSQASSKTRGRQIHLLIPDRKASYWYSTPTPEARLSHPKFLQRLQTPRHEIHSHLSWIHLELRQHGLNHLLTIINGR